MAEALEGHISAASMAAVRDPASVGGASIATCPGNATGINCDQKLIREVCNAASNASGGRVASAVSTVACISGSASAGLANAGTDSDAYTSMVLNHSCAFITTSVVSGCAHNAACRVALDRGIRKQCSAGLLHHLLFVAFTNRGFAVVHVLR